MTNPNSMKRPYEVSVAGWLFIVVGILNTAYHLWKGALDRWMVAILFLTGSAIVAGVFLLRGARSARWLALAWIAFHVGVRALNSLSAALPHAVLLLVVGHVLLGPLTSQYFQQRQVK
jgi:hypothetical protein